MHNAMRKCIALALVAVPFRTAMTAPTQSLNEDRIVLPLELVAGKPATLAVLTSDGRVDANARVLLSNGVTLTTDDTGRARFVVPAEPGILFAQLQGTEIRAAATVRFGRGTNTLQIKVVPRLTLLNETLRIRGSGFDGNADKNQVTIADRRSLVLAASAEELIILAPPDSLPGATELDLKVGDNGATARITLIRVSAAPTRIPPGKKEKIALRVLGTDEPITLALRLLDPGVVKFTRKSGIPIRTRGGSDNSVELELKGLRAGDFSIAAQLAPEAASADISAAGDFLVAAKKITPTADGGALAKILENMKKKAPDFEHIRKDFEKLILENHAGNYDSLLRAAHEALFGTE